MSWTPQVDFSDVPKGSWVVTDLSPVKGSPDRLIVEVEGEPALECQQSIIRRARVVEGAGVSSELLGKLERADQGFRAYQKALELLGYRARSKTELRRRLRQEVDSNEVVEEVLEQLEQDGYIDDEEFARMFIRDRIRLKPRGPYKIASELGQKGIDPDRARDLFFQELEEMDTTEIQLAREVAEKWLSGQGSRKGEEGFWKHRKRLLSKLGRSGFNRNTARQVANELLDEPH